jgi:hypothetical protein
VGVQFPLQALRESIHTWSAFSKKSLLLSLLTSLPTLLQLGEIVKQRMLLESVATSSLELQIPHATGGTRLERSMRSRIVRVLKRVWN